MNLLSAGLPFTIHPFCSSEITLISVRVGAVNQNATVSVTPSCAVSI